jgi:hypothetical protein
LLSALVAPVVITAGMSASSAGASSSYYLDSLPAGAHPMNSQLVGPKAVFKGHVAQGIPNLDTIPNFSGHFNVKGYSYTGAVQNQWLTNFVGHLPQNGGTTNIDAPIVPVSVNLQNPDLSSALYQDGTQHVSDFVNGPDFSNTSWSSSPTPTQLGDAIDRAQFAATEKPNWHTMLNARPTTGYVINVPYGDWFIFHSTHCGCDIALVDASTFDSLFFNVIVQAITDGLISPQSIATFAFKDVYLYEGNPGNCCILGYHTYVFDTQPNGVETRWVLNYSSWISPGIFSGGFQDVTANSHELAETMADPFVVSDNIHGLTPFWSSSGQCQEVMEVGDVIEGLANATYPVTMNSFTYHPQNEALAQWFNSGSTSDALDHAFSYPNESVLPTAAAPQNFGCS